MSEFNELAKKSTNSYANNPFKIDEIDHKLNFQSSVERKFCSRRICPFFIYARKRLVTQTFFDFVEDSRVKIITLFKFSYNNYLASCEFV